ncbi:MAG: hypothetical protein ACRDSE_05540 [Pseudonocardiaceae bacterium]
MTGRAGSISCAGDTPTRWRTRGRPDFAGFLADPGPVLHGRVELTNCTVPSCRYGQQRLRVVHAPPQRMGP